MKRFKEYLTERKIKFNIPKELQDNYKIKGNLGNVEKWKAKIMVGNSGGGVGKWENVGYVMISIKDKTIIPISRNDEHHTGYDFLQDMDIPNVHSYYPVFAIGNNYVDIAIDVIRKQRLFIRDVLNEEMGYGNELWM